MMSLLRFLRALIDDTAARIEGHGLRAARGATLLFAGIICVGLGLAYVSVGLVLWLSELIGVAGALLICGGALLVSAAVLLQIVFGTRRAGTIDDGRDAGAPDADA